MVTKRIFRYDNKKSFSYGHKKRSLDHHKIVYEITDIITRENSTQIL